MKIISHRGNWDGPNPNLENHPDQIIKIIEMGVDVEIDLWLDIDGFSLGHDKPQYGTSNRFLIDYSPYLWVHCKNLGAFHSMVSSKTNNFFWHENDRYTLTSNGTIWAYPGNRTTGRTIIVQEHIKRYQNVLGICTDYVIQNLIKLWGQ